MGTGTATRLDFAPETRAYHDFDAVSQSGLKLFADDPGLYRDRYVLHTLPDKPPSDSMQWGLDFENLVFYRQIPGVMIPREVLSVTHRDGKEILVRRGDAWEEWKERTVAEYGPNVRMLRDDEWDATVAPLLTARDAVLEHPRAAKLLDGEPHVALTWTDDVTGLPCKCQLDIVPRLPVLTDLKTAGDNDPESFTRAVLNFRYHWQAWWYREAWARYTGEVRTFAFVVVKSKPSYTVETYDLHPDWYALAEVQIRDTMERLAAAYANGQWRTPTFGKIVTLKPPKWAY